MRIVFITSQSRNVNYHGSRLMVPVIFLEIRIVPNFRSAKFSSFQGFIMNLQNLAPQNFFLQYYYSMYDIMRNPRIRTILGLFAQTSDSTFARAILGLSDKLREVYVLDNPTINTRPARYA